MAGAAAAWRAWVVDPFPLENALSRRADGRPVTVVGRIASPVERRRGGDAFVLDAQWLSRGGRSERLSGKILVYRRSPDRALLWGDTVTVWGPLAGLAPARAPGTFDARSQGARHGARVQLFVPKGKSWLVRRASVFSPLRWVGATRDHLQMIFSTHLTPRTAAVVSGLLLGRRSPELADVTEDFRRSGTIHLLVASGSNVGFAVGVWWLLARWAFFWPRRWILGTVPLWAFLYAGVAGANPPVMRAAWMVSLFSLGHLLGRWDRTEQPLFLSAGILLLANPAVIFDVGFQMSYAATWGLVTFLPRWNTLWPIADDREPGLWARGARRVFQGIGLSVAAQWALFPLLLFYFGRFSLAGVVANVISIPLAELCLLLGLGVAGAHSVGWVSLSTGTARALESATGLFLSWTRWAAQWPWAEWKAILPPWWAVGVGLCVLGSFVWVSWSRRPWGGLVLWVGLALGGVWVGARPPVPPDLRLVWWERKVVLIQTPSGNTVLDLTNGPGEPLGLDAFLQGQQVTFVHRWWRVKTASKGLGEGPLRVSAWEEGPVRWRVFRQAGAPGVLIQLDHSGRRVMLGMSVAPELARAFLRNGPLENVDAVGWHPLPGASGAAALVSALDPRHVVFTGRRPSRALRRAAQRARLWFPSQGAVAWSVTEAGPRFSTLAEAAFSRLSVW